MQPDREPAAADAGELTVHPGLGIVEATARRCGQPLGQPADGGFVGEANITAAQAVSVVDPDVGGRGDQDVGGSVGAQQRLENARTGQLGFQDAKGAQDLGVTQHPAGLRPDSGSDDGRAQRSVLRREAFPDPVDQ